MATKKSISINYGFPLQTILIILKLAKVINWSWWIVWAPTWIAVATLLFVLLVFVIGVVGLVLLDWYFNWKDSQRIKSRRRKTDPLNPF
jgi:hypothetical protein